MYIWEVWFYWREHINLLLFLYKSEGVFNDAKTTHSSMHSSIHTNAT